MILFYKNFFEEKKNEQKKQNKKGGMAGMNRRVKRDLKTVLNTLNRYSYIIFQYAKKVN